MPQVRTQGPLPLQPITGPELDVWWTETRAAGTPAGKTILESCVKVSQGSSGGSGVLVGRGEGGAVLVLSAAHVFSSRGPARIRLRDGSAYPAYVHDYDRRTDVALLSAEIPPTKEVTCTKIAAEPPAAGTVAIKIGFPAYAGGEANVRRGQVLRTRGGFLFNASLYVRPGDSGGGVFAEDGTLISIVSGYTDGEVLWGTGTTAIQQMVTKHNWTSCIFKRWHDRQHKQPPGEPGPGRPPEKKLPEPPADRPPVQPVDLKPILDEIAKLRQEMSAIKTTPGPKGEPGPAGLTGPRGEPGSPGLPGRDTDPAKLAALEAELERLRKQTFIAELLDDKGQIKQRVLFGPEQPLRLKLVPVK